MQIMYQQFACVIYFTLRITLTTENVRNNGSFPRQVLKDTWSLWEELSSIYVHENINVETVKDGKADNQ